MWLNFGGVKICILIPENGDYLVTQHVTTMKRRRSESCDDLREEKDNLHYNYPSSLEFPFQCGEISEDLDGSAATTDIFPQEPGTSRSSHS